MTSDVEQVQDPKLYNAIKDRGTEAFGFYDD